MLGKSSAGAWSLAVQLPKQVYDPDGITGGWATIPISHEFRPRPPGLSSRQLDSKKAGNTAMATKLSRSRTLASVLRPSAALNDEAVRAFSVSAAQLVNMPKEAKNMRLAPRDHIGALKAPLVNPADKYQSKADNMHKYGAWLMGCLPKYIQQFSVWKDELTIYISPSGVIPVFTFLKCMWLTLFSNYSPIDRD